MHLNTNRTTRCLDSGLWLNLIPILCAIIIVVNFQFLFMRGRELGATNRVLTLSFMAAVLIAMLSGGLNLSYRRLDLALAAFAYSFWTRVPLRSYDSLGFGFVIALVPFAFLLLPYRYQGRTVRLLMLVTAVSSIAALFIGFLLLFGFNVPYLVFDPDGLSQRHFLLYPGFAHLTTNVWSIGPGVIGRNLGFLQEPGHFGIFCAALLAADRFDLRRWTNRLVVVGGLLTFSLAFYLTIIVAAAAFGLQKITPKRLFAMFGFVTIVGGTVWQLSPDGLIDRLVTGHMSDTSLVRGVLTRGGVLDSDGEVLLLAGSENLDIGQFLIGLGHNLSASSINLGGGSLNGFLYRYGLVGVLLLALWLSVIAVNSTRRGLATYVIILAIAILAHRSWMVAQVGIVLLLSISATWDSKTVHHLMD